MRLVFNLIFISIISLGMGACQKLNRLTGSEDRSTPAPVPQLSQTTGISGAVSIEIFSHLPHVPNQIRPYQTEIAINKIGSAEIILVQSDRNGQFSVNLHPGDYTITPADPQPLTGPSPTVRSMDVNVTQDSFVHVNILYLSAY